MKIALPLWQGRVSPVFDVARKVLVVVFNGDFEVARREVEIHEKLLPARVTKLTDLHIDTLLCGAISRPFAAMLSAAGIRVISFLAGDADKVLRSFLVGRLDDPGLHMPGCSTPTAAYRTAHEASGARSGTSAHTHQAPTNHPAGAGCA